MKLFRILACLSAFAMCLPMVAACAQADGDEAGGDETQVAQNTPAEKPAGPVKQQGPIEFAGAHILIMYQGSQRAPAEITRSKEEALELCTDIAKRAKAGEDFAELAKEHSDGPSAPRGGDLGSWVKGRMVAEFDTAMEGLEIGGISDPVETAFGYHVLIRKKVDKVGCRHILVMHTESQRAPADITRSKEEAQARAEEVLAKLEAGGVFEELAQEYSDGPSAPQGGDLGRFGRGAMVPAFEQAAFGLEVGGVSGLVETPFGYHIIQRYQ